MLRNASLVLLVGLMGCENAIISETGNPAAATSPSSPQSSSQPLTGVPFLPSLSPHRLTVAGDLVLVADPEGAASDGRRPQLHLVSLSGATTLASIELPDGANPGAVEVNPATGIGYVVARGLGGLYPIDLANRRLGKLIATCSAPVDLASRGSSMVVACRGGELVTVTGEQVQVQQLGRDLTSVVTDTAGNVFVATAGAELLQVGSAASFTPLAVPLNDRRVRRMLPNTARRLVTTGPGAVAMLFQQSIDGELGGDPASMITNGGPDGGSSGGGYGGANSDCPVPAARAALGILKLGTGLGGSHASGASLAVDLAVSPDHLHLAVVDAAGGMVELTPAVSIEAAQSSGCFGVDSFLGGPAAGGAFPGQVPVSSPMAAGFAADGRLVVLSGVPQLQVQVFDANTQTLISTTPIRARAVPIGFTLFHSRPTPGSQSQTPNSFFKGSSLACASCHPDGLSNGAVTTLDGVKHRVMPLAGRLADATEMHWDAKPFHDAVVAGTWEKQMGGAPLALTDELSLRAFVGQLQAPPGASLNAAALAQGQAAFVKAECSSCHLPTRGFTNDGTANVGQGLHKVPSLRGLAYSAPYMSNGCAATLEERFDNPACGGGELHGKVSRLDTSERAALLSYLRSL